MAARYSQTKTEDLFFKKALLYLPLDRIFDPIVSTFLHFNPLHTTT